MEKRTIILKLLIIVSTIIIVYGLSSKEIKLDHSYNVKLEISHQ